MPSKGFRRAVAITAVVVAAVLAADCYERTLTSYRIRQAYFLGKSAAAKRREFLRQYFRSFPLPKRGPHVAHIEISTPFHQVVQEARRAPDGYSPLRAERDHRQRSARVVVRVRLELTPTYPAHSPHTIPAYGPIYLRDPDFWQAFTIRLVQRTEVAPVAVSGTHLYTYGAYGSSWLQGAIVTLEYDAAQVASVPTRIEVFTPDGHRVEARFDLAALR